MILIITGTIKPQKSNLAKINNEFERLEQYKKSLRFYIEKSKFKKILFIDNSNFNIDLNEYYELAERYGKKFEFLQFEGDVSNIELHGKGYGEGEIIEYAINNSKLMKNEDYFIKITGRLIVKNINKIFLTLNKNINYFNTDDILGLISKRIDTRFYFVKISDYKEYLMKSYMNVYDDKGYYLEHVFYNVLKEKNIKHRCFYIYPKFEGVSGSTGKIYNSSNIGVNIKNDILAFLNMFSVDGTYLNKYKVGCVKLLRNLKGKL